MPLGDQLIGYKHWTDKQKYFKCIRITGCIQDSKQRQAFSLIKIASPKNVSVICKFQQGLCHESYCDE